MKSSTATRPMREAVTPARMESEPSEGPTERSSTMVSLAGSAPERRMMASSLVSSTEKRPEICPEPPRMGVWMTGAETTLPSSTMAKGLPTFFWVSFPNSSAPFWLKRKVTMGSPVRLSKAGWASTRSAPSTVARREVCTQ